MSDPECLIKLDRAFDHLDAIEKITRRWVKQYRVTHDPEGDLGAKIVRLHAPSAPNKLGLLVGECLHNARSFLDNLAFHLAVTHSGSQFTAAMQQTSEFPIFSIVPPPSMRSIERSEASTQTHETSSSLADSQRARLPPRSAVPSP